MHTDIHALSGIRTHDPSVRGSEDNLCLRPRGHCDWHKRTMPGNKSAVIVQAQTAGTGDEKSLERM
jgi:hypothetical protein